MNNFEIHKTSEILAWFNIFKSNGAKATIIEDPNTSPIDLCSIPFNDLSYQIVNNLLLIKKDTTNYMVTRLDVLGKDLKNIAIYVKEYTPVKNTINNKRPSKDEYYLDIAKAVAMRSTCLRRRYGAVIVKDDQIISTGYNGSARGEANCIDVGTCPRIEKNIPQGERYEECVAIHAEQNALLSAARKDTLGATLYLYGVDYNTGKEIIAEPCKICMRMIKNAGIEMIISTSSKTYVKRGE